MLMPGPASATQIMSRLGLRRRWNATGTGFAQPNTKGEPSSSSMTRQHEGPERIDVADRVEAHPAEAARRVVAEPVGHPAMRGLVQRDRGHHGHGPDGKRLADARRDRSCDGARQQFGEPALGRPRVEVARRRAASGRQNPVEPREQRGGQRRHRLQHGAVVVEPPRAEQRQIAAGLECGQRPVGRMRPLSACMARSSLRQEALNAEAAADGLGRSPRARWWPGDRGRGRGRRRARSWRTADRAERAPARNRGRAARRARPCDHGQRQMAVDHGAAVPRQMLDHRRNARRPSRPSAKARASAATRLGSAAKERLPMASVMPGRGHVEARARSRCRCRPRAGRGRSAARAAGPPRSPPRIGRRPDGRSRRADGSAAPLRRAQAHDPAAFLIDQHRQAALGRRDRAARRSSARSCARSAQLRWNRMTPAGGRASNSSRSAASSVGPAMPTTAARGTAPRAHASLTGRSARR